MQSEMVVCPWNEFWQHYSPWTPSQAIVQEGVSALETVKILNGNKWKENIAPSVVPDENAGLKSLQGVAWNLEDLQKKYM